MPLERRQQQILRAIVLKEQHLRADGRGTAFSLLRVAGSGGRTTIKPPIDGDARPTEGDIRDFEREGLVHTFSSSSPAVILKFELSADGRRRGLLATVSPDLQKPQPTRTAVPAPTADELVTWIAELESDPEATRVLASGGAFTNIALAAYGSENLELLARRFFELRDDGLIAVVDVGAEIDQLSDLDRLGMTENIRLTVAGRDRASRSQPVSLTQVINIVQSQVALGNIQNFTTFVELLDRAEAEIERVEGLDAAARQDAKGLLARLRGGAGAATTATVGGAGGAVLATILKQLLGLG